MQVQHRSLPGLGLTSTQVKSTQPQLSSAPVLSFGSSEEVLALVENQSEQDESLIHHTTDSGVTPDVSAYAYSNDVLQELLAMLIKSDQPAQLPVIAETPGTASPEPPVKLCPNVLQNRTSFTMGPPAQSSAGTLSILTSPNSAVGTPKMTATAAGPDSVESRSFDNLIRFLVTNTTSESRRNSTGSLRAQSTSGFRVPQACIMLCSFGSRAFHISCTKNMEFLTSSHSAVSDTLFI